MEPRDALIAQAAHCRRAWKALGPEGLATWHVRGDDDLAATWRLVLVGRHPLADWLAGEARYDALPATFPDGSSPRRLFSSHPFTGWFPWSTRLTFPASSSTPPAS